MQRTNRLTLNGLTTQNLILILISVGMIGVSIYLMNHFYQLYFPEGFNSESSLCSISTFWSCDQTTTSIMGSIYNVPTAFFGILVGSFMLVGSIFPSESFEQTNKFVVSLNFVGCIILFIYSIVALGGLCPMCTVYYILSGIAFFLFKKYSALSAIPDAKFAVAFLTLALVPSVFMHSYFIGKMSKQADLSQQYVKQFFSLKQPGDPINGSGYMAHKATEKFEDAPVRVSIFSDFECPFCKVVAEQIPAMIKGFEDKVNVQFMFYPLDQACNINIKGSFHQNACYASYLAACSKDKFAEVHDFIFAHQNELSVENINLWAKQFNLTNCFDNDEIKSLITTSISAGEQYNLKSTPTIIVNGRKIEGLIPIVHFRAIIQEILKK